MTLNFQDLVTRIYNEIPRNPKTALKWAEEGLTLTNRKSDGPMMAKLILCRAHALRECGRYEEAVRDYDTAKKILISHKEAIEAWRTAIGKIDALNQLGRYEEALRTAEKALQFFSRNRLPIWLAKTHANMGNVYHNLGKYPLALKHYRIGYSTLHKERPLDGYVLLFNQASIHLCEGKPEQALDLLDRCRTYFEEQKLSSFLGRTYYNV
ncbi:tetratricopeptide repeat protein, partial [bacterium]|nr:tetratricopeptide repeat protein [bacterium]